MVIDLRRGEGLTVIIGLEHEGNVYMGGDSMAAAAWDSNATALRKVFVRTIEHENYRRSKFLIGYTDSFRMGQILQYHLTMREQILGEEDEAYMVTVFVEAARECLKSKGYARVENNTEVGGQFMVGYNGRLWVVHSNFQVMPYTRGFDAIGAGQNYALGAMPALKRLAPEKRIRRSLEITADLCNGVRAPFVVECI